MQKICNWKEELRKACIHDAARLFSKSWNSAGTMYSTERLY